MYRSLYYADDADNDPYGGHYATIVADFTVPAVATAAGALTPQELAARVYASAQQHGTPNAFLLLCRPAHDTAQWEPAGVPKITLFHWLAQYTARQGLPVEWDDMAFAFKGDVIGPQADIPV
jgi:type II secretory pathway component PulM